MLDKQALEVNNNVKARDHWNNRLKDFAFGEYFNDYRPGQALPGEPAYAACRREGSGPLDEALTALAGSPKAKHLVLLAALAVLAQKYAAVRDVVIFSPAYRSQPGGRPDPLLPVRLHVDPEITFAGLLMRAKTGFVEDLKHRNYPLEKMFNVPAGALRELPCVAMVVAEVQDAPAPGPVAPDLLFSFRVEGGLRLTIDYQPGKFGAGYAGQVADLYLALLGQLLANRDAALSGFGLASGAEQHRILRGFNRTEAPFPAGQTIIDLFLQQVQRTPGHVAVQFRGQGLTYRQLDARSNQVAAFLRERAGGAPAVVGVQLDRSPELIVAVFGILRAGCVYMPVTRHHPVERIRYALRNAGAGLLFTEANHAGPFEAEFTCVDITQLPERTAPCINLAQPGQPAYIIYTSGSTGKPKGACIRHRSVVNRLWWMQQEYGLAETDVILQKTPIVFDVSVWELFWWSFVGARLVLAEPGAEKDPGALCRTIDTEGITILHFVPSMLNTLLGYLAGTAPGHSLGSIRHLFASGEELTAADAQAFLNACPGARLHNLYGPTEATVDVSYYEVRRSDGAARVPIGKPISNTQLLIFSPEGHLQPVGVPGELFIGGENLATGYVNQEELTREKFVQSPLDPGTLLYRTGDLARWRPDGNIEFLGRIDHQVKIRGNRIETAEIERVIESSGGVTRAVVLPKAGKAGLYLVGYLVTTGEYSEAALVEGLAAQLPDYMVPAYFIPVEKVPLTVNGKVDRQKLLALPRPARQQYVAPASDLEKALVAIWQEVLGEKKIGVEDNFFQIGGDSILGIRLLSAINAGFAIQLPLADIYAHATVRQLAPRVAELAGRAAEPAAGDEAELTPFVAGRLPGFDRSNVEDVFPMSDIQKGMIYHYLNETEDVLYFERNVIDIFDPAFDPRRFRHAVQLLVDKHATLRTAFELESFLNVVHHNTEPVIHEADLSGLEPAAQQAWIAQYLENSKRQPFDLALAPLWRMHLLRAATGHRILVIEICHAILDGWSYVSMVTELGSIYGQLIQNVNFRPARLALSYKDFVREEFKSKQDAALQAYWKSELLDYRKFALPPVKAGPEPRYLVESMVYDREKIKRLTDLAASHNTNLKHLFFSAFAYALGMLTDQSDVMIGLVSFNRPIRKDSEKVLGCFINMVPVRLLLPRQATWAGYLGTVEKKLTELKRYDKVTLLEILRINHRQGAPDPLFEVQFNFTNFQRLNAFGSKVIESARESGLGVKRYLREDTLLDFTVEVGENRCTFDSEYSTSYISTADVKRLHDYFDRVIANLSESPGEMADTRAVLPPAPGGLPLPAPLPAGTLAALLAAQLGGDPCRVALRQGDRQVSYGELRAKTNRLARRLRGLGAGPDVVVGIWCERSPEMIVAVLAVVTAGAAYLPLGTGMPEGRLAYVLENSKARLLLYAGTCPAATPGVAARLDLNDAGSYAADDSDLPPVNAPHDLAYIMYTSGSTGRPKGVMIEQRSLVNRLAWMQKQYPLGAGDRLLQKTPFEFDVSAGEIFGALLQGCPLSLLEPGQERYPEKVAAAIAADGITVVHFVPSMLNVFLACLQVQGGAADLRTLRHVFVSGEVLSPLAVQRFYAAFPGRTCRLTNLYGPTEASIEVTFHDCLPGPQPDRIPIGRPIDNTRIYVMNDRQQVQGPGVPGELCIAGVCLARGYAGETALTQAAFVDDPCTPGRKMYRTGDVGRWLEDGTLEYLGRKDDQVKIRGYRIEPGEIESLLNAHAQVRESVVTAGDDGLCAYVVPAGTVAVEALRDYLARYLPPYMIPGCFVALDRLPLTPSGKADRKALPPAKAAAGPGHAAGEPDDALAVLWCETLALESGALRKDTHFFDAGGHSINAIALVTKVNRHYGLSMQVKQLYHYPVYEAFAAFVAQEAADTVTVII